LTSQNLDNILAYRPSIDGFLDVLKLDPNFALAHIGLARSYQVRGKMPEAKASAARASELAETTTKRERQHVEVIAVAINGNAAKSAQLLADHAISRTARTTLARRLVV